MQWKRLQNKHSLQTPSIRAGAGAPQSGGIYIFSGSTNHDGGGGGGVPCNLWSRSVADVQENVFLWLRGRALL